MYISIVLLPSLSHVSRNRFFAWQTLERRTPLGRVASAPVLTVGLAAVSAAAHVIPKACSLYDVVWSSIMPLGTALCLLEVDLTNLARWKPDVLVASAMQHVCRRALCGSVCCGCILSSSGCLEYRLGIHDL